MRPIVEVWPSEDRPEYAVRFDQATVLEAKRAISREYGMPTHTLRYLGPRVVNLPPDEEHKGRRRRAHIFTDEPA